MNQSQAIRAVELIGGYRKTANMVKNLNGEPMHEGNMKKAIKRTELVPDWLSAQIIDALEQHALDVELMLLGL